jgi:hypothetical protein
VGKLKPETMFNNVDLPQPEWPITQINSPCSTLRLTPSRTVNGPYIEG